MNVYDFDKTIYKKDSSIELYIYIIKEKPAILFKCLPCQLQALLKYKKGKINKEKWKEQYFCFLKFINIDNVLENFTEKEMKNINRWYLSQKKDNDVIISASPEFLVYAFAKKLNVHNVIATKVDKTSGTFLGKNCYGSEKVERFSEKYNLNEIEQFYSDSISDEPMAKYAQRAYRVEKKSFCEWR